MSIIAKSKDKFDAIELLVFQRAKRGFSVCSLVSKDITGFECFFVFVFDEIKRSSRKLRIEFRLLVKALELLPRFPVSR
jgi:hypothetical protein